MSRSESAEAPESSDDDYDTSLDMPLAEIMRPTSLKSYVGQEHLLDRENGAVTNFLNLGYLPSMILYGPPGVGKTTLAAVLADEAGYLFVELSATDSSISDLRQLSDSLKAENAKRLARGDDPIQIVVFIDEIHRFQKNQQDFLLPLVEAGHFTFIGATTVDPKVRIRQAILSRCQFFQLRKLDTTHLQVLVSRALLQENVRRRKQYNLEFLVLSESQRSALIDNCAGDARHLINAIEALSANCISEKFIHQDGLFAPVEIAEQLFNNALVTIDRANGHMNPRLASVYAQMFRYMNSGLKPDRINTNKRPKSSKPDEKALKTHNLIPNKKPRLTKSDAEAIPFVNLESGFTLDSDNSIRRHYAQRMEVSDSSDVDNVPETFLSDLEDNETVFNLPPSLDNLVAANYSLLYLLSHNESPFAIARQLILFTLLHTDSDKSQLVKTMAQMKSLKASNASVKKTLSNCIGRLSNLNKKKSDLPELIGVAEKYLEKNKKIEPSRQQKMAPQVDYDQELVRLLSEVPVKREYLDSKKFVIEPLEQDDNLGQPIGDEDLSLGEILAKISTPSPYSSYSSLSTYRRNSVISSDQKSCTSVETIDTEVALADLPDSDTEIVSLKETI